MTQKLKLNFSFQFSNKLTVELGFNLQKFYDVNLIYVKINLQLKETFFN